MSLQRRVRFERAEKMAAACSAFLTLSPVASAARRARRRGALLRPSRERSVEEQERMKRCLRGERARQGASRR